MFNTAHNTISTFIPGLLMNLLIDMMFFDCTILDMQIYDFGENKVYVF